MALRLRSANRHLIRQINQAVVLGVIHDRGPISRTAIAEVDTESLEVLQTEIADLLAHRVESPALEKLAAKNVNDLTDEQWESYRELGECTMGRVLRP